MVDVVITNVPHHHGPSASEGAGQGMERSLQINKHWTSATCQDKGQSGYTYDTHTIHIRYTYDTHTIHIRYSYDTHTIHIVLYCIVLYCIMRPYTEGQLDRYHIGIPRENPKSALNLGRVRDF